MSKLIIGLSVLLLTACASPGAPTPSQPVTTSLPEGQNIFACIEDEAGTIASLFSGHRIERVVVLPENNELDKDDWMEVITKCFMNNEQAGLLQVLETINQLVPRP